MKIKPKLLLLPALAFALAFSIPAAPASAAKSASEVQIQITFSNGLDITGSAISKAQIKNGVSYMPASLVKIAGIEIAWNNSSKTASFTGWNKSFQVKLGSISGVLDGNKISLDGAPYMYNKELYVPAKFLAKAMEGGPVVWDPAAKTLLLNRLHMYRSYSETYEGQVYSLSLDSGELYVTSKQNKKTRLATLGYGLDLVDFTFERTPAGLTLLQISNNYGEPHIHVEYYSYLLKNGSILRQGHTDFHTTFGEAAVWADGKLVMNDRQTLRLIEDGTCAVAETIDLPELLGTSVTRDVYYNVEAVYPDVLLVRPSNNAFLTLVNRSTGEQTLLYKELLNPSRQQQVEQPDSMFPGDYLYLIKRDGDVFTFKARNMVNGKDEVYTYTLAGTE
ncbi:copper amine oxidase N-terminal domain-containing protein [Paenibacillus sp. MMS20-IR301]|uniref:copper amine oxidase N-terminal domain-containing protein n=1 Tax=Paenibacillus sp. MMS20-IR301 TaxID=2895946 RepID=UPI0028F13ECA|nr:copper amine oxidase N-terminal domain-containing protein [Paenibacillus sp. MMS20-IR301]WNS46282.1 copper amine oxidase N-terminal domain-containing protein [Paenibacillus sp. MMS20-IR301]